MAKSDNVARVLAMAAIGSGSGENTDYSNIKNKPQINGNELIGDKSAADLGLATSAVISNVSYEASTGILTFEKEDGTNFTIDLPLELLIESGEYNPDTQQIVLTLANKDVITIDVKDLISTYYGDDETIELFVEDEKQKFRIKQTIMDKINDKVSFRINETDDEAVQLATWNSWYHQYKAGKPTTLYYKDRSAQYYIHTGFAARYENFWRPTFIAVSDGTAGFSKIYGIQYGVYRTLIMNINIDPDTDTVTSYREYLWNNNFSIVASGDWKTPSYPLGTKNDQEYTPTSDYNPSTKLYTDQRVQSIAPDYDATSTYALGDYVSYQGKFYKCITAIETAEAWNSEHWSETNVKDEYKIYYYRVKSKYGTTDTSEETLAMFNEMAERARKGQKVLLFAEIGSFDEGTYSTYGVLTPHITNFASKYLTFKFPVAYASDTGGKNYWQGAEIYCSANNTTDGIITSVYSRIYEELFTVRYGELRSDHNTNQVLTTDNTSSFTPTNDYNPATKKYVDDNAASVDGVTTSRNAEGKIEVLGVKDIKTNLIDNFWTGTRAEYNALETKEENVFYAITDEDDIVTKAEIGVELNGSYADDTLSLSLLNPYSEVLSTTAMTIPAGTSTCEVTLTKDVSGAITANKTIAEIKAAQTAGDIVYVAYNNSLIPLVFVGDNTLKFTIVSDNQSITISCDNDVWSEVVTNLLPLSGGTMTGALNLYSDPTSDNEAATKIYVDSKITSSQHEHNTLYYATIDGTNDNWYNKDKLQPVLQAAYDGGYHDIMIRTTSGSRFITSSGLDLQSISETVSANLQFVNLQNLTGSTTTPNTIFYGYCYANTVKLDSEGNVVISGLVGKTGGSVKVMKESALTDISGYDATKTQVLKNVNGILTWVEEG